MKVERNELNCVIKVYPRGFVREIPQCVDLDEENLRETKLTYFMFKKIKGEIVECPILTLEGNTGLKHKLYDLTSKDCARKSQIMNFLKHCNNNKPTDTGYAANVIYSIEPSVFSKKMREEILLALTHNNDPISERQKLLMKHSQRLGILKTPKMYTTYKLSDNLPHPQLFSKFVYNCEGKNHTYYTNNYEFMVRSLYEEGKDLEEILKFIKEGGTKNV